MGKPQSSSKDMEFLEKAKKHRHDFLKEKVAFTDLHFDQVICSHSEPSYLRRQEIIPQKHSREDYSSPRCVQSGRREHKNNHQKRPPLHDELFQERARVHECSQTFHS